MRHEAQREGELGARRGAIDAWEKGLLANRMLTQDAQWYTDNGKYRQVVALVFGEWNKGQKEVCQGARKTVEAQPRGGEGGKGGKAGESAMAGGGGRVRRLMQGHLWRMRAPREVERWTMGFGTTWLRCTRSSSKTRRSGGGRGSLPAWMRSTRGSRGRCVPTGRAHTQVSVPSLERGRGLWMCSRCSLQLNSVASF